jgi:putative transposase
MVEDGAHLWNCLVYVDLNMVRAGVVAHPVDWSWCGYRELVGEKTRYRLLDRDRLLEVLGKDSIESFVEEYRARIERAITSGRMERQRRWTECIAVGSQAYVKGIAAAVRRERLKARFEEGEDGSWSLW